SNQSRAPAILGRPLAPGSPGTLASGKASHPADQTGSQLPHFASHPACRGRRLPAYGRQDRRRRRRPLSIAPTPWKGGICLLPRHRLYSPDFWGHRNLPVMDSREQVQFVCVASITSSPVRSFFNWVSALQDSVTYVVLRDLQDG